MDDATVFLAGFRKWARERSALIWLSPVLFVLYAACGGDSTPPPPPQSYSTSTASIVCAASALNNALDTCSSAFSQALPSILSAPDAATAQTLIQNAANTAQQQANQNVQNLQNNINTNIWNTANQINQQNEAAIQGITDPTQQQQAQSQALSTPPVNVDPSCNVSQQPDPTVSCQQYMTQAFLLWKSAQDSNGQIAYQTPQWQAWIQQDITAKVNQAAQSFAAQNNLTPQQAAQVGQTLQNALLTQLLPNAGIPSQLASSVLGSMSFGTTGASPTLASTSGAVGTGSPTFSTTGTSPYTFATQAYVSNSPHASQGAVQPQQQTGQYARALNSYAALPTDVAPQVVSPTEMKRAAIPAGY